MTLSDDRLKAFEAKYANDKAVAFKITAKRNKMLGLWAAEIFDLDDGEAYAKNVIAADFEEAGDQDVIRKVEADFDANGKAYTPGMIADKLKEFEAAAKEEVAKDME